MQILQEYLTEGAAALIGLLIGWITKLLHSRNSDKNLRELITKQHQTIKDISQIQNQKR